MFFCLVFPHVAGSGPDFTEKRKVDPLVAMNMNVSDFEGFFRNL